MPGGSRWAASISAPARVNMERRSWTRPTTLLWRFARHVSETKLICHVRPVLSVARVRRPVAAYGIRRGQGAGQGGHDRKSEHRYRSRLPDRSRFDRQGESEGEELYVHD